MIKMLMMLDTPLWVCITSGLTTYVVILRRRIRAFKNPWFSLPKRERRQLARDEIAQLKEDRDIAQLSEVTRAINEGKTHL